MRGMLIYNIKTVLELYKPVCIEHLTDQCVFCLHFTLQEIFFKQIHLLRSLVCLFCPICSSFPDSFCLLLRTINFPTV